MVFSEIFWQYQRNLVLKNLNTKSKLERILCCVEMEKDYTFGNLNQFI